MKGSTAAVMAIGTLVFSTILAACGAPPNAPPVVPTTEAPATPRTAPESISDEERLEARQQSIGMLINDSLNQGQAVSEYLVEQTQEIEEAKQALRLLDGQREALAMLVMQYCAEGATAPDCVFDLLDTVQRSRESAIEEMGLSQ